LTGKKDRTWLRLGLASSNARHGREPLRRAPERWRESGLQAEAEAPPPVLEDEGPVEVSEFSVKELSSISSGEDAEEGLHEDAVGDEVSIEVSEFSIEELSLISSGEKAEEGSHEGAVGDDGAVDDDERSSGVKGRSRRSSVPSQGSRVPVGGA